MSALTPSIPSLRNAVRALLALALLTLPPLSPLHGCGRQSAPAPSRQLTVLAAASLADAFTEIGAAFEAAHPGVTVRFSFAGSNQLRSQLEHGGPGHVFASADRRQMDAALASAVVVADSVRVFAHNRLALIVPRRNDAAIVSLHDLARPGLRIVVADKAVPVGNYTRLMLEAAARAAALGEAFVSAVESNVASREENVAAVVAKVALNEADAGFAYASDALGDNGPRLTVIPLPEVEQRAEYVVAVTAQAATEPLAAEFVRFLLSPAGAAALESRGFSPPTPASPSARAPRSTSPRAARPRERRRPLIASSLLALPLFLLLAVPIAMLCVRAAPASVLAELRDRETLQAVALSLATTALALLVSVLLGLPLAYWLAHSRSRAAVIVESIVDLPTVLPPAVAGLALLLTLGRNGPVGAWLESLGVRVAFSTAAVVIAQVFVASPFFVRTARAGFASVDRSQREAAIVLGASSWVEFRRVLAPQAAPFLAAGAAMCWSRALGEFGATIIFAGNLPGATQTMPLAIYIGFELSLDRALVLSIILIALSLIVLLAIRLAGRRITVAVP